MNIDDLTINELKQIASLTKRISIDEEVIIIEINT